MLSEVEIYKIMMEEFFRKAQDSIVASLRQNSGFAKLEICLPVRLTQTGATKI